MKQLSPYEVMQNEVMQNEVNRIALDNSTYHNKITCL